MATRGARAKFLNENKKGRWSPKEKENLKCAYMLCESRDATPKELSRFVPSRDEKQIRKFVERLKVAGEFEEYVEGIQSLQTIGYIY